MFRRSIYSLLFGGLILLLAAGLLALTPNSGAQAQAKTGGLAQTTAAPTLPAAAPTPAATQVASPVLQENLSIGNDTCLACHSKPFTTMDLEDGTQLGLYVPPDTYNHSVHGESGIACVQCHTTVGNYPHPPFSAQNQRDVTLKLNEVCARCHSSQHDKTMDSVHAKALAEGNTNAAVCTDCHGAHSVERMTDPATNALLPEMRTRIPEICARCHNVIYQQYANSVHGSALEDENNTDVPTCISCHGVHNIVDPTSAAFRIASPLICARCHTDPTVMDKYGISTDVLNTYVSDFHGTTVAIFAKEHIDQQTNKPVCFDCHGVHDIKNIDDPQSGIAIKEHLLARCQVCHPDANANFPSAWLSHYIPSPQKYPLVYWINVFYLLFIPGVLGGMAILVGLDAADWLRKRSKPNTTHVAESGEPPAGGAAVFTPVEKAEATEEGNAPESTASPEAPEKPPEERETGEAGQEAPHE
jgi:hypothetical protein